MASSKTKRKRTPKSIIKLPDLEQSKSAVLNSQSSLSSQRTYDHAIMRSENSSHQAAMNWFEMRTTAA
jgi:hypothetical protein